MKKLLAPLSSNSGKHRWSFFRAGGFDQVLLKTGADLMALDQLDQKLWVALSCPTYGLEFDQRTLELIDTDADGQVRAPELIAAVQWAGARLKDTSVLASGLPGVPLAAIRPWSPDNNSSGTVIPRNSAGRVYCGQPSNPCANESRRFDSSSPSTPGTRRVTASTMIIAASSPPVRT